MTGWRETFDEIFPIPADDLAFLDDPDQVERLVERAMSRAARRARAPFDDLLQVLDALLAPPGPDTATRRTLNHREKPPAKHAKIHR